MAEHCFGLTRTDFVETRRQEKLNLAGSIRSLCRLREINDLAVVRLHLGDVLELPLSLLNLRFLPECVKRVLSLQTEMVLLLMQGVIGTGRPKPSFTRSTLLISIVRNLFGQH